MTLLKCPECYTEVSSKANSCPKCGFPIAQNNNDYMSLDFDQPKINKRKKEVHTIQKTSKGIKLFSLISLIIFFYGLIKTINAGDADLVWEPLFLIIGLILFIVSRILKWWHHQ
jgi:uncharacterized membrane protein YvbJ